MSLKIVILGINGFIGSHLTRAILEQTDWQIYGMDLSSNKIAEHLTNPRLQFTEGDIGIHREWIAYHIKKCQVVLPLVAIANPAVYVKDPLSVFELDFEANLEIIRHCVKYGTRVIFPSTSEVYGMCQDPEFQEDSSALVLGPIHKERWIYSCSKQLLDRLIYAYGKHHQLAFSIFRPFNWIGSEQDNILAPNPGSSRVVTQFLSNIIHGKNIQLVDGGIQRRSFTDIEDGIACLMKIIANQAGCANGQIFNIGNPNNDVSIQELADLLLSLAKSNPAYAKQAESVQIMSVSSQHYYGEGYQDISARVPSIKHAQTVLQWQPKINLKTALEKILDYYAHKK